MRTNNLLIIYWQYVYISVMTNVPETTTVEYIECFSLFKKMDSGAFVLTTCIPPIYPEALMQL